MRSVLRLVCLVLVGFLWTGCDKGGDEGGGGGGSVTPVSPSGPPATATDLAGTWSGRFQGSVSGNNVWAFTWNAATQQGGASGASTLTWVSTNNPPAPGQQANGTITATISGTSVSLAISFPPNSLRELIGSVDAACSMTGGGTVPADATTISGTITLNFSSTCTSRFAQGGLNQTGAIVLRKG